MISNPAEPARIADDSQATLSAEWRTVAAIPYMCTEKIGE